MPANVLALVIQAQRTRHRLGFKGVSVPDETHAAKALRGQKSIAQRNPHLRLPDTCGHRKMSDTLEIDVESATADLKA